jgi:ferredoxin
MHVLIEVAAVASEYLPHPQATQSFAASLPSVLRYLPGAQFSQELVHDAGAVELAVLPHARPRRAVRVLEGDIDQREALGLSRELRAKGYGLLCVARSTGPLVAETQDEDEVYDLQFGRFFGRGRVKAGLPLDED